MYRMNRSQLQARALRAAATHLRNPDEVVRHWAHLWESADGKWVNSSMALTLPAPRGCVCAWVRFEWVANGLCDRDDQTDPVDWLGEQIPARIVAACDEFGSGCEWGATVTRALKNHGPEWCADMLDCVAARTEQEALQSDAVELTVA